ncbi:SDR family NAD(P)-dependent oxidoreductase [Novosphingobium lentum]|uniref:SDR family NAD(P)-dependent oxidoreductase n=1 Tax=Novosphingobium lentum TaxID=145287 RepID=UPI0008361578|nr:SDR family NAD(P)-dependent oxidoreductase [Novosphingobium lentum]
MTNTVALVTGASQGVGRGAARGLGSKGMTVYLTARNADGLKAAAAEVDAAGGKGIAVVCDHRDDAQVKAVFDRIEREQGRLDLLINNAAAVYGDELSKPGGFWEKDLKLADMIVVGLRSDYVAAFHAAPLMIRTGASLIANISFYGAASYFVGPAYGAAKAGTDKMVHDMAIDLAATDVAIVSYWPGYVRTDEFRAIPEEFFPEPLRAILPEFETPEFTGLVIAGLLADPERKALSGKALIGAELGLKYGIRDIDGKQPRTWTAEMGRPLDFFVAG